MPRLRRRAITRKEADPLIQVLSGTRGADRVLTFCRKVLTHGKGAFAGKPFDPLPFQEQVFRGIFDPITSEGLRRIRNRQDRDDRDQPDRREPAVRGREEVLLLTVQGSSRR